MRDKKKRSLSAIPGVVQLPGGIRLQAIPFKVVEYDDEGRPRLFEIMPEGTPVGQDGVWGLFADERAVRARSKP